MQLELQCRQTIGNLVTLHVSVGGQAIWNTLHISPNKALSPSDGVVF